MKRLFTFVITLVLSQASGGSAGYQETTKSDKGDKKGEKRVRFSRSPDPGLT